MNLSGIPVQPCSLMDEYDVALRDLHKTILSRSYTEEQIKEHHIKVITIRNEIAKRLLSESWSRVPADQRY